MRLRTCAGSGRAALPAAVLVTAVTAAVTVLTVVTAPAALAAHRSPGHAAVALAERGHTLVAVGTSEPADTAPIGLIRGYAPGDTLLIGIDHHPRTGALLGVGDGGGIYRVTAGTAELTKIGQLTVAPDGRFSGVDIDPAANVLRVVGDTGQNLRHPFTGDTDLPGLTTTVDTPLDREGVSGIAYTADARLFGVDTVADRLVAVDSPAQGRTTGLGEDGGLGDLVGSAGLDILTTTGPDGPRDRAYAVVRRSGVPLLLSVDLTDGSATRIGRLGLDVVDLAVIPVGSTS